MQSEQPLPRTPAAGSTRRPASPFGRASGLYGEVLTLPVVRRGTATAAERKASI